MANINFTGKQLTDQIVNNQDEYIVDGVKKSITREPSNIVQDGERLLSTYWNATQTALELAVRKLNLINELLAPDSAKLNGKPASYYEDIVARLGYKPVDEENLKTLETKTITVDSIKTVTDAELGTVDVVGKGETVNQAIENNRVETSVTGDNTGTNILVRSDGSWGISAYNPSYQTYNIESGKTYFALCKLKDGSIGRVRQIGYRKPDNTNAWFGSTDANKIISYAKFTAMETVNAVNLAVQEGVAGLVERDYQIFFEVKGNDLSLTADQLAQKYSKPLNYGLNNLDNFEVDGVGDNLLNTVKNNTLTINGVQISTDENGELTLDGTCTSQSRINVIDELIFAVSGGAILDLSKTIDFQTLKTYSIKSQVISGTAIGSPLFLLLDSLPTLPAIASIGLNNGESSFNNVNKTYGAYLILNSGDVYNNFKIGLMLNEGTTAKPYKKYNPSKIKFNGKFKATESAEDKIESIGGINKIHKNVSDEIVLDGSADESWIKANGYTEVDTLAFAIKNTEVKATVLNLPVTNSSFGTNLSRQGIIVNDIESTSVTEDNYIIVRVAKSTGVTDVATLKTWLTSNSINLVANLATPLTIEEKDFPKYGYDVDGALKTIPGENNTFSVDSDTFKPTVSLTYNRNVGTSINDAIEGVIANRELIDDLQDQALLVDAKTLNGKTNDVNSTPNSIVERDANGDIFAGVGNNKVFHAANFNPELYKSIWTSGATDIDPQTTLKGLILSNHANTPDSSKFWYITTDFWGGVDVASNRTQVAVEYNPTNRKSRVLTNSYQNASGWGGWNELLTTSNSNFLKKAIDISGQNLDNIKTSGEYNGANLVGAPSIAWYFVEVIGHNFSDDWAMQRITNFNTGEVFTRQFRSATTWSDWDKQLTQNEYGKILPLAASYTVGVESINKTVVINQASPNMVITVPHNTNIPVGTQVVYVTHSSNDVEFAAGVNCTLESKDDNRKIDGKLSMVVLIKIADTGTASAWDLAGDLKS